MKSYPVYVPGDPYRGSNPGKVRKRDNYNRVASKVQAYLNAELEKLPDDTVQVFFSHSVASDIHEDPDLVQRIIFGIDAGSGGVTICKGDFQRAMDKRSQPPS